MKTSIIVTMVENLSRLREFIPERDLLISRVVDNILKALRKEMGRYKGEISIPEMRHIEVLIADPATKEMLVKVGEAVLDYYEHVDTTEQLSEVSAE